ncbi:MAG: ADP-ribosylation factor-like protein [Candidatus Paceibacterota bacterium]
MTQYKCVFVGDAMVGKTNYVLELMAMNQEMNLPIDNVAQVVGLLGRNGDYNPTLGVEVHPVIVSNTTFNIWDCAGQERFGGLRDGYYIMGDAAIIMFDNMESFRSAKGKWTLDMRRTLERVPIVYVWSKYENETTNNEKKALEQEVIEFERDLPENSKVYKINSKRRTGMYEPFQFLLSKLQK